jgi:hypothetical protein
MIRAETVKHNQVNTQITDVPILFRFTVKLNNINEGHNYSKLYQPPL